MSQRRTAPGALFLLIALLGGAVAPVLAAPQQAKDAGLHESVLDVVVNDEPAVQALVVLRDRSTGLWVDATDFTSLRLHVPAVAAYRHDGHDYYPLQAIDGIALEVDETAQRLSITVPEQALETTRVSAPPRRSTPVTRAAVGAFLNYQLSEQHVAGQNVAGAFGELGAFGPPGVVTSSTLARDGGGSSTLTRLDTTFTHDFIDSLQTLNLGDSVSDPGTWGYAVRFAGVRFSKNFSIRPDLLTTPLLSASGSATVPSAVDVFVNNQRVSSSQLPPGPFVIDNLASVTGAGDVRVVVTDALGRTRVITQSFYSGIVMLAPGLSEYSAELGTAREDYTVASNHYAGLIGAGTYRRGLSEVLTVEGHAEFEADGPRAAGLNVARQVGTLGILSASAAAGGDADGTGYLAGVGFEHRGQQGSLVINSQYASRAWRQLGDSTDPAARVRAQSTAQAGYDFGRFGTLGLAWARQTYTGNPTQEAFTLSDNFQIGRQGYLGLSVTRTSGTRDSTAIYLLYTVALTDRRSATARVTGGSGPGAPQNSLGAGMMQSLPLGAGTGWRAEAATDGSYDLDLRRRYQAGDIEAELARNGGVSGQSLSVSGAMTWLDHDLRFARQVPGSFAIVEVDDVANLPIYVDNQLMTHTDDAGRALIPNLRPYEDNRISVEPEDLPLDTSISARTLVLAPAYRSGVIARFPVQRIQDGTLRLTLPDGAPVPLGAVVEVGGASFPVVRDGVVYLTGLSREQAASVDWAGGHCMVTIPKPPRHDAVADLGTLVCAPQPDDASAGAPP